MVIKTANGEVIEIRRLYNEVDLICGYIIAVETKELPDLKLGECRIIQR